MAPAPGHDYFSELPLEMLQHIASYLGSWDRLKLRTVFPKSKVEIMVATLGELISTVYVSPTITSLEHFQEITKSPFFAQHIRKLVYIPRAIHENCEVDGLVECRRICPELSRTEVRKAHDEFKLQVAEHKAHCSSESLKLDHYVLKSLQKGLERLQGLKTVVLANNIQDDGLNATVLWYSDEYAKRRHTLGFRAIPATDAVHRIFFYEDFVPFQLFAIFETIRLAKLNLRNMELGNNLCGQLEFGIDYHGRRLTQCAGAAPDALTYVLPKLRKLTISCSDEWTTRNQSSESLWKYIASRTNGIQDLTLYLDRVPSFWNSNREEKVFEEFLRHGNYPSLQKLRIQGDSECPGMLNDVVLIRFLHRHYDSLKQISFAGVIVSEKPGSSIDDIMPDVPYNGETVCGNIRHLLRSLPVIVTDLSSFEMKLHRQDKYELYYGRWLQGHTLDTLAAEMGLTPSSANEWDFGQAVRKMLKGA